MPLPMVHLLLAEKIGKKIGKEPDAYFLLGSIAPDAIHMRPGTNRKDKHRTHFFRGKQWDGQEVQMHWETVLEKLECYADARPEQRSFATGYCLHTLLDITWIEQVFNVLARTLRAGGIGFEDIRTKYYAETNACDAFLYQQSVWVPKVRSLLTGVPSFAFEQVLTAEEIGLWRDVVLGKMDVYETAVPKEAFYITNDNIHNLTDALAEKIVVSFAEKGYTLL